MTISLFSRSLESLRRLFLILLLGMMLSAPVLGQQTAVAEKNGKDADSLIEDLKDDNSTIRAALGAIKDARAVEPLIQALMDSDDHVQKEAAKSLEKLGWRQDTSSLDKTHMNT